MLAVVSDKAAKGVSMTRFGTTHVAPIPEWADRQQARAPRRSPAAQLMYAWSLDATPEAGPQAATPAPREHETCPPEVYLG
jgi:hypothetical protein